MTTGLWLMLYGTALAWTAPSLLGRLTKTGLSPQMGVAAWLTAIATTGDRLGHCPGAHRRCGTRRSAKLFDSRPVS